jgi:hypothetical protein
VTFRLRLTGDTACTGNREPELLAALRILLDKATLEISPSLHAFGYLGGEHR